jgi:hypothetical protein
LAATGGGTTLGDTTDGFDGFDVVVDEAVAVVLGAGVSSSSLSRSRDGLRGVAALLVLLVVEVVGVVGGAPGRPGNGFGNGDDGDADDDGGEIGVGGEVALAGGGGTLVGEVESFGTAGRLGGGGGG